MNPLAWMAGNVASLVTRRPREEEGPVAGQEYLNAAGAQLNELRSAIPTFNSTFGQTGLDSGEPTETSALINGQMRTALNLR